MDAKIGQGNGELRKIDFLSKKSRKTIKMRKMQILELARCGLDDFFDDDAAFVCARDKSLYGCC